ncbi:Heterokaryon incompatibility protein 6, OR allele [Fusarium oxysporum f. sp. albedinis]|nr:Heterokaryon incompatibility protein 6, OR allele [Fusarium oxysporum f. sp. albedinis]
MAAHVTSILLSYRLWGNHQSQAGVPEKKFLHSRPSDGFVKFSIDNVQQYHFSSFITEKILSKETRVALIPCFLN